MRKNFGKKPWLYPQPVLMVGSYDENGKPDLMNAAWGGVGGDTQLFLCLSPEHKTVKNILAKKAFTVSIGTLETLTACDYAGIVSGNSTPDKMEKSGLHSCKAGFVDAPVIEELPLCIECELISYEPESCRLFGEIINTSADDSILTDGKVDPSKLRALCFDICNANYLVLGEVAGKAFSDGAKLK